MRKLSLANRTFAHHEVIKKKHVLTMYINFTTKRVFKRIQGKARASFVQVYSVSMLALAPKLNSNVLTATSALINKGRIPPPPRGPAGRRGRPAACGTAVTPYRAGPLTCFSFTFSRRRACRTGTGRNLGAGAAAGVFLHAGLRAVSGVEAELRAESRRAL